MKLLLWDIDGTLIDSRGLGGEAMNMAFQKVYKLNTFYPPQNMAGKTDLEILKEYLDSNNFIYSDLQSESKKVFPLYFKYLKNYIRNDKKNIPFVFNGVKEILTESKKNKNIIHGLLTGNYKPVAKLKLQFFDLWKYFKIGAFGERTTVRSYLATVALNEFRKKFKKDPHSVYVIGDTPKDILVAKEYNLISVAVATGLFSIEKLKDYNPDFLISDLTEFPEEILT